MEEVELRRGQRPRCGRVSRRFAKGPVNLSPGERPSQEGLGRYASEAGTAKRKGEAPKAGVPTHFAARYPCPLPFGPACAAQIRSRRICTTRNAVGTCRYTAARPHGCGR